ncbi:MAG: YegS/Rv2252/BmrU family lipid kinase [Bacteroidales bacterium]|nr:YegS/Rv2252/BmrU family lipid kinase [Bacteroidales bacterium]
MAKNSKEAKPVVFIINPIAGIRQKDGIIEVIQQSFQKEPYQIYITERSGNAFEITKEKIGEKYDRIVAVGGDGTVNEVASALVGSDCKLGIIPAGSGNGLARYLRIPVNIPDALAVINNYKTRKIDAGIVNHRYFFCTCGTGFDASVGKVFAKDSRRGMISYLRATIHQYVHYSPKSYILKISRKKIKLDAFMVTFANAGQFGNNAYIAPNALIDDGMLDLCILRPFPRSSTITLGLRLFFKNIDQSPYLEVMRIKKASLKRKGKKKVTLHTDGEPLTFHKKLKVGIVPGAVTVMVPVAKKRRPLVKSVI